MSCNKPQIFTADNPMQYFLIGFLFHDNTETHVPSIRDSATLQAVALSQCSFCLPSRPQTRGHLVMSEDNFGRYNWGEGLLASRGKRLGMLLNIPRCTGQALTTKNCSAPNANSAELKKC